jgi:site-specific recombinase XerD
MVVVQQISGHPASQGPTDFLDLFLLNKRVENCSPRTLECYQQWLTYLLRFTGKGVLDVQKYDVELYMHSLQKKGCSPHYVRSAYRHLRVIFSWMVEEQFMPVSPMKGIKVPKVPRDNGKDFLTEQQFQALLSVCPGNFCGIRNKAWLWLLWTTGARFSELAKLKLTDLDWQEGSITVLGKGNKLRQVPYTRNAQKAVYQYLTARKSYVKQDYYPELWISEERKPLTPGGLTGMTQELYRRAGIRVKDVHHIFRRSWAWRNLKTGMSPKFVQLIGGWESMSMLELYVKKMTSQDALKADWR